MPHTHAYHFPFQRYYMQYVLVLVQSLIHLRILLLCLEVMAQERELRPSISLTVGSNPFSNKYFTVSTLPPPHAKCKAVPYNIPEKMMIQNLDCGIVKGTDCDRFRSTNSPTSLATRDMSHRNLSHLKILLRKSTKPTTTTRLTSLTLKLYM